MFNKPPSKEWVSKAAKLEDEPWEADLDLMKKYPCPCPTKCSVSTGIDGRLTRGSGELTDNGYWQIPCPATKNAPETSADGHWDTDFMTHRTWVPKEQPTVLSMTSEEAEYLQGLLKQDAARAFSLLKWGQSRSPRWKVEHERAENLLTKLKGATGGSK